MLSINGVMNDVSMNGVYQKEVEVLTTSPGKCDLGNVVLADDQLRLCAYLKGIFGQRDKHPGGRPRRRQRLGEASSNQGMPKTK